MKRVILSASAVDTLGDSIQQAIGAEYSADIQTKSIRDDGAVFVIPLAKATDCIIKCGCYHTYDGYFCLLDAYELKRQDPDSYKKIKSDMNKMLKRLGLSGHKDGTNICVDFTSETALVDYLPSILDGLVQISKKF